MCFHTRTTLVFWQGHRRERWKKGYRVRFLEVFWNSEVAITHNRERCVGVTRPPSVHICQSLFAVNAVVLLWVHIISSWYWQMVMVILQSFAWQHLLPVPERRGYGGTLLLCLQDASGAQTESFVRKFAFYKCSALPFAIMSVSDILISNLLAFCMHTYTGISSLSLSAPSECLTRALILLLSFHFQRSSTALSSSSGPHLCSLTRVPSPLLPPPLGTFRAAGAAGTAAATHSCITARWPSLPAIVTLFTALNFADRVMSSRSTAAGWCPRWSCQI